MGFLLLVQLLMEVPNGGEVLEAQNDAVGVVAADLLRMQEEINAFQQTCQEMQDFGSQMRMLIDEVLKLNRDNLLPSRCSHEAQDLAGKIVTGAAVLKQQNLEIEEPANKLREDTFDDMIEDFASGSLSVERNRGVVSPSSPKFRYSFDFGDDEGLCRNSRSLPPTSVEKTPDIFQDMDELHFDKGEMSAFGARSEAKMLWIPGQILDVLAELRVQKCYFFQKVLSFPRKALGRRQPLQLYVPVCFLKEHGDKLGKWAILQTQSSSNSWRVRLCFCNKRSQLQICRGWREFAIDNNLKRGDALIFVLNFDGRCFQVYIFPETQRKGTVCRTNRSEDSRPPPSETLNH